MPVLNMDRLPSSVTPAVASTQRAGVYHTRKPRSACDRCHAQKLRCVRIPDREICGRCDRLQATCRFGPRAQKKKRNSKQILALTHERQDPEEGSQIELTPNPIPVPLVDTARPNNPIPVLPQLTIAKENETLDLDLRWHSDLDRTPNVFPLEELLPWDNLDLGGPDPLFSPTGIPNSISPCSISLPPVRSTSLSIIENLASLNISLSEVERQIPLEAGERHGAIVGQLVDTSHQERILVLDEIFRLTKSFLDILKQLFLEENHWDEGTVFMAGSCHCRLTEIYSCIFQHMRGCVQHSAVPRKSPDWAVLLPSVQMGCVHSPPIRVDTRTPAPSHITPMYIAMIKAFSLQLWQQLADIMGGRPDKRKGLDSDLTERMWAQVIERTDGLIHAFQAI